MTRASLERRFAARLTGLVIGVTFSGLAWAALWRFSPILVAMVIAALTLILIAWAFLWRRPEPAGHSRVKPQPTTLVYGVAAIVALSICGGLVATISGN